MDCPRCNVETSEGDREGEVTGSVECGSSEFGPFCLSKGTHRTWVPPRGGPLPKRENLTIRCPGLVRSRMAKIHETHTRFRNR